MSLALEGVAVPRATFALTTKEKIKTFHVFSIQPLKLKTRNIIIGNTWLIFTEKHKFKPKIFHEIKASSGECLMKALNTSTNFIDTSLAEIKLND
jgi:hypothetical protein